jgi:hypothetical protein
VRTAPKRLATGGVMTVNELGVKRTEPIETVEDLLVMKDPRGYVKAALIFAKDLDTAAAVDAAYKTYMAGKGEQAVLDAARRRAVNKPQLTFKPNSNSSTLRSPSQQWCPRRDRSRTRRSISRGNDLLQGASASYINRNLGQVSLRRPDLEGGTVGIRSRYLLRSITPGTSPSEPDGNRVRPAATIDGTSPRDTDVGYPARLDAAPTARGAAAARTPLQSGDETLVINGKRIADALAGGTNARRRPNGPRWLRPDDRDDVEERRGAGRPCSRDLRPDM